MEPVVIDFEFLRERHNEIVVKEASVAGKNVSDSFNFEPPITWRLTAPLRTG